MQNTHKRSIKTALVPPFAVDPHHECIRGSMALGILTIGTLLQQAHQDLLIANPNVFLPGKSEGDIIRDLAEQILDSRPHIIGFSTVCGFYPLTLLVARACKERSPGILIVLGGPQASVTYRAVLRHCPWVDVVVIGEADQTVGPLWTVLGSKREMAKIPGIAFSSHGRMVETGPALRVTHLDHLPVPDYRLLPEAMRPLDGVIPIEAGRGCPYGCAFCSTSRFWGRKSRSKSPERIHREILEVRARSTNGVISLVHDMLAGNRETLVGLCSLLSHIPDPPRWECAIRLDHLDPELLGKMASAGCVSIFVGLESASERVHKLVRKGLYLGGVQQTLEMIQSFGINPVVSFIIGFPDETLAELMETLSLALELRCQLGASSKVFMHILAPLHGTPLYDRFQDRLVLDPLANPDNCFLPFSAPQCMEMMKDHPELCAAGHHFSGGPVSRRKIVALFFVLKQLLRCYGTLKLMSRLHGAALAQHLYACLDGFRMDQPDLLHFTDGLQKETEHYLEGIFSSDEARVPYWRDLYRYESERIRFDLLGKSGKRAGIMVHLKYDIRRILEEFEGPEGPLPVLSPTEEGVYLWQVVIRNRQLEVALPRGLATRLV